MTGGAVARAALLIAAAVGGSSCAWPAEPTGAAAASIVGGGADSTDTAVVALVQASTGALCSGVLVAPTVVLTAGHCVSGVAASDLRVLVGGDTSSPDQTVMVASTVTYPTYTSETEGIPGGVDLGAVTLAAPLAITPAPLGTDTTDAELTGVAVTVVGYGASDGTDNSGTGVRRQVTLAVTVVCTRVLRAGNADANACLGDSGGAVLLGGRVVALVSGGRDGCFAPTTFTRLDAHADWLAAVLAGDVASSCPRCVAADPSCTAATETHPATDGGEADAGAEAGGGVVTVEGGCEVTRVGRHGSEPGLLAIAMVLAIVFRLGSARSCAESSSRSRSRSSSSSPARASPGRTAPTRRGAAATRVRTWSA